METTQPAEQTSKQLSFASRIGWTLLIFAALYVCYFSHLGAIGFVGPDEPRFAWVAREMAETGDWVTPRLYGRPWLEKPPLYYWGAALCFKLCGVSETAARLPSAISALLATLALAWLALRLYGAKTARWLLLLLPTTVGMIGFSHAATTDMPFSGTLTVAMVAAAVVLDLTKNENTPILPRTPWLALLFFGFFLGLAVLAKGPAGIILCCGAIFFWALFTKRWRDCLRILHPVAIAAFCLTALPWYILCARRNPDFFQVFVIEHNVNRYLTPEFHHIQPFWFYVPVILVAMFPWSLGGCVLAKTLRSISKDNPASRLLFIFLGGWFFWPVLFFSISQSKLPGYVLPSVFPAVFLFAAAISLKLHHATPATRWAALLFSLTLLCVSFLFMFSRRIASGQHIIPAPWHSAVAFPLLAGGTISAFAAYRRKIEASMLCSTAAMLLALLGLHSGLRWLDPLYSARQTQADLARLYPDFDVHAASVYHVSRGIHYGLSYYLREELPEIQNPAGAARWVFTTVKNVPDLERQGLRCIHYLVFPGAIPCKLENSARGPAGGGQAQ